MEIADKKSTGGDAPMAFLEAVARAYSDRHRDLSDICFVFPNKRAGRFFLRHLARVSAPRTLLAPQVLSVADFMELLSGRDVDSRIDMLFRLYNVYCRLIASMTPPGETPAPLSFDRFLSWGETILGDFSEVDQYMVEADKLFENVRDYREISSDFLTDSQRELIERYFGYSPQIEPVKGFWRHVGHGEDVEESDLSHKFVELWKLLPELYDGLRADLEAEELCMPGSAYRLAYERIAAEGTEPLPWSKVVFVGFNSISTSENMLFDELVKYPCREGNGDRYAEFFWDCAGPVLGDEEGRAATELRRNIRNFPAPEWGMEYIDLCDTHDMPGKIVISAAPSNSAQVKIAGLKISEILKEVGADGVQDARVAVVLPDEALLLPLLYSLPPELQNVNLTMGYSMRFTSVASFIHHLRRLQSRRGSSKGEATLYHEDLRLFLSHPLTQIVVGSATANRLNGIIANSHIYWVPLSLIAQESPELAEILQPLPRKATPEQTAHYIDNILLRIDSALADGCAVDGKVKQRIERSQIQIYRNALSRLMDSVRERGMTMDPQTLLHLADRLLAGEKVTFEGEPLEGLQVMGLLETRALDFDRMIILSMNDKSMPRRGSRPTFIPDALRRGYGLQSLHQAESLYSYYFYRMISRASGIDLIYDARAGEGMRRGGKSRFLMQLEMLYAPDRTVRENYSYTLGGATPTPAPVEKSDALMQELLLFTTPGSGRNLSPSALMKYCKCQLQFYYTVVKGVSDDSDEKKFIDPITQGNIIHSAMLNLYFPEPLRLVLLRSPLVLEKDYLKALSEDKERIAAEVRRRVNSEFFHLKEDLDRELPQGVQLVANRLAEQVSAIIAFDASRAPLTLAGGEIKGQVWMPLPSRGDGEENGDAAPRGVNMHYQFDRVDLLPDGSLRVIDYKTGNPPLSAPKGMEDVFNGNTDSRYILQLLLYSELLRGHVSREQGRREDEVEVHPEIYITGSMEEKGGAQATFGSYKTKSTLDTYSPWREEFLEALYAKIDEIFDPSVPFTGATDEDTCGNCGLRSLCGKE